MNIDRTNKERWTNDNRLFFEFLSPIKLHYLQ